MPFSNTGTDVATRRIITFEKAVDVLEDVVRELRQKVAKQLGIDPKTGGDTITQPQTYPERFGCWKRFEQARKKFEKEARKKINDDLLPQKTRRKYGPVKTRSEKTGDVVKPKAKPKRKGDPKRRKHRKTGKPKGRPPKPKPSATAAKTRNLARQAFKQAQSANNLERKVVGWLPYPKKRAEKVPGWLDAFLKGY